MHRFSAFWHMRLPHRLQSQKVKSQSHRAGAYCGGHLAAQLVSYTLALDLPLRKLNYVLCSSTYSLVRGFLLCGKQDGPLSVDSNSFSGYRPTIVLIAAGRRRVYSMRRIKILGQNPDFCLPYVNSTPPLWGSVRILL